MQYTGTYKCGHKGTIKITGKTSYREWKYENEFSGLCPDCQKALVAKERAEKLELAIEEAKDLELPELTGTEKQVAWAMSIRSNLINDVQNKIVELADSRMVLEGEKPVRIYIRNLAAPFERMIINETSAKFWIEHKDVYDLMQEIAKYYLELKKEEAVPDDIKKELEEQRKEATVIPDNCTKDGVAKIKFSNNVVTALYVKDDDFIRIVKGKGFKWDGGSWSMKITSTTGKSIDRIADLGNALLANGFTVEFPSKETKELSVAGTFEPVCNNWIILAEDGILGISWKGVNDTLYKKSKLLPGARWSKGVMEVSVEYYEEVIEFADTFGFKLTEKTLTAIEEYKNQRMNFETRHVEEVIPEPIDYEARLKSVLEREGVIEDLVD